MFQQISVYEMFDLLMLIFLCDLEEDIILQSKLHKQGEYSGKHKF